MSQLSVLFVCTENICRSPMAEAILRQHLTQNGLRKQVNVDSAGTHCSQPGHKPDNRAVNALKADGIKLRGIKARRLQAADFERYDYILAMDHSNRENLLKACPKDLQYKIQLVMSYMPGGGNDVPDPYYGSVAGFQAVKDTLHEAVFGVFRDILKRLG